MTSICVKAQKYKTFANLGHLFLLRIINAAMTPSTQPMRVSRNTMSIEPQPRSITAKGGKMMDGMGYKVVNLCDMSQELVDFLRR